MSTTQSLLQNHLLLVLAPLILNLGCGDKPEETGDTDEPNPIVTEEGTYYLNIEEDADCPSIEEVNTQHMPEEEFNCSGQRFEEITEFLNKYDYPYYIDGSGWGDDEDPDGDHCTYQGLYEAGSAPEWCMSVGRAMLREGKLLTAKEKRGEHSDWLKHSLNVQVHTLSIKDRHAAGEFYRTIALMEHASIAAFHHFALELLSFGAPSHLLEQTQTAISDEIRHAKTAFSLASDLLGESISPAQMNLEIDLAKDLCTLAERVAREAAINETLAVIIASHQLTTVKDPAIFAYLSEVIRDETRHAELAWETLRWCIEQGGDPVRETLRSIMREPLNLDGHEFPEIGICALGVLSKDKVNKILLEGFEKVVQPAFESLLSS
jgi:hypothetical protein